MNKKEVEELRLKYLLSCSAIERAKYETAKEILNLIKKREKEIRSKHAGFAKITAFRIDIEEKIKKKYLG